MSDAIDTRVRTAITMTVLVVLLPLAAMTLRVPWGEVPELLLRESSRQALLLSLRTSLVATLLCLLLGVPLAVVLARSTGADVSGRGLEHWPTELRTDLEARWPRLDFRDMFSACLRDQAARKPASVVAHFELTADALRAALEGRQLQPVIRSK